MIVHSWWGHYVSLKPGTGNWVEALTTYCTNYYYKELKMAKESAHKHRRDVMRKICRWSAPFTRFPLREFEGKETELDGQIRLWKGLDGLSYASEGGWKRPFLRHFEAICDAIWGQTSHCGSSDL